MIVVITYKNKSTKTFELTKGIKVILHKVFYEKDDVTLWRGMDGDEHSRKRERVKIFTVF